MVTTRKVGTSQKTWKVTEFRDYIHFPDQASHGILVWVTESPGK